VAGFLADHPYDTRAAHDFAVTADFLYRSTNLQFSGSNLRYSV